MSPSLIPERQSSPAPIVAGSLIVGSMVLGAGVGFGLGALVGVAVLVGLVGLFVGLIVGFVLVHGRYRDL
jgi:hypothetical protein